MQASVVQPWVEFVALISTGGFAILASAMGFAALACCYFGFSSLYHSRLIADMPTSKARSAAQGYIELEGTARMMPGEPIYSPLSGMPCVWYRYRIEQKGRDVSRDSVGWCTLASEASEGIFFLEDDTGVCIIDPEGAKVTPSIRLYWCGDSPRPLYTPKETGFWSRLFSFGAYRYTEERIDIGEPLYAIGQLTGLADGGGFGIGEATRDLLATWKRDRAWLLGRFDANRDGEIDMDEWCKVRHAAEKQVISTWQERQQQSEANVMKKPSDGRPYILSWGSQDWLISRYRNKALLGIIGFLVFLSALAWTINIRFG